MVRILNQFEISFDTNEIITMAENNSSRTKVEPRIMHVLQILIKNSPKVVSREQLIFEVWKNYGGADDALNQSVSHLRKMLNDTDKENRIIETVIKKGYRFVGEIEIVPSNQKNLNYKIGKSRFWIATAIVTIAFIVLIIYSLNIKETSAEVNSAIAPEAPLDKQ